MCRARGVTGGPYRPQEQKFAPPFSQYEVVSVGGWRDGTEKERGEG